jgi:hypothetical protein
MIRLALLAAAILGTCSAGLAQPVGIGFVQAEEGTWWCRAGSAAKAFDCAAEKCRAGAGGQECHEMRWCGLAGWSGLMVVWLPEFHSTAILCGAPSELAVVEALKAICANDEVVTRCDLVTIIDPDGNEKTIEGLSWPGPTSADSPSEPEAGAPSIEEQRPAVE